MNSNNRKVIKRWVPFEILILLLALDPPDLAAAEVSTIAPPSTATDAKAITSTWLTFGLNRVEWFQVSLMGNPLWQYLAALIYVALAFYAQARQPESDLVP